MKLIHSLFFSLLFVGAFFFSACSSDDPSEEVCPIINVSSTTESATCGQSNGSAEINISGGSSPYTISIGGQSTDQSVSNLTPGTYNVAVTDSKGCMGSTSFTISNMDATFTLAVENLTSTTCGTNEASLDVVASGGNGTLTYSIGGETFQESATFMNIGFGEKEIFVKDQDGCSSSIMITVETAIDFGEIQTIVANNCALSACHDGTNSNPDFTSDATIVDRSARILARTSNNSMPPGSASLTDEEKEKIACWSSDLGN